MDVKRYMKGTKLSLRIIGLFMVITLLSGTLLPVGVMATTGEEIGIPEEVLPPEEPADSEEETPEDVDEADAVSEQETADDTITEETPDPEEDQTAEEPTPDSEPETEEETAAETPTDDVSDSEEDPVKTEDDTAPETAPDEGPAEEQTQPEENADEPVSDEETADDVPVVDDAADAVFGDIAGDEPETGNDAADELVWDDPEDLNSLAESFFEALSDKAFATAEILEFAEGAVEALTGAALKITELAVDDLGELFVNYVGEEIQNYAVFDLGFYLDDESEVEPGTEVAVTVDLTEYLADQAYDPASLVLYHHEEDEWGEVVNTAAVASYEDGGITVDEETGTVTAMFVTDSFSAFTLRWSNTEENVESEGQELSFYDLLMAAPTCEEVFNLLNSDPDAAYALTTEELTALRERVSTMEDPDENDYRTEVLDTLNYLIELQSGCTCGAEDGIHDVECPEYGTEVLPDDAAVGYALTDGTITATEAPGVTVQLFNYSSEINNYGISASGYGFFHSEGDSVDGNNSRPNNNWFASNNHDFSSWSDIKRLPLKSSLTTDGYPDTTLPEGGYRDVEYPEDVSLGYLFDSTTIADTNRDNDSAPGKVVYPVMSNGGGLFKKDDAGYYVYDSAQNAAYYNSSKNEFILYDKTIIRPSYTNDDGNIVRAGNFLPFNEVTETTVSNNNNIHTYEEGVTAYQLSDPVDLWFGMVIEFEFLMPKDGQVNDEPMVFDFHGDDDVMVYIDDQLVLDISGSHYAESGTIDFSKGLATVTGTNGNGNNQDPEVKEFSEIFTSEDLDGGTFKDYTVHRLKFFYLERGGSISYCKIRFNMPTLPQNSITIGKELTVQNNSTVAIEEILKDTLTYKFRIMNAEDNAPLTDENYIVYKEGDQENAVEHSLDENGIIELKSGERATFEDILVTIGEGKRYYVEELIPYDLNGQYEGVQIEADINATKVEIVEPDGTTTTYMGYRTATYNTYDGSTYSVFTNRVNTENLSFLQIEKQLAPYANFPDNTFFNFKVELGGEILKNTQFNIQNSDNEDVIRFTDDKGILTLCAGETATLAMGILSGTEFEVTEVDGADTYVTYAVECGHPEGVECSKDHRTVDNSSIIGDVKNDGSVWGKFALANSIKIIATNSSYKPGTLAEVTLTKTVAGNMGDHSKEFTFEAYLKDANENMLDFPFSEGYTVNGKIATITLAHEEKVIIQNVPIGSTIYIRECDYDPYDVTVSDATKETIDEVVWYKADVSSEGGISIVVTNTYNATIDTGILLDSFPYIILFAVVGTGVILTASEKRRTFDD